jgi:hypothetical protein
MSREQKAMNHKRRVVNRRQSAINRSRRVVNCRNVRHAAPVAVLAIFVFTLSAFVGVLQSPRQSSFHSSSQSSYQSFLQWPFQNELFASESSGVEWISSPRLLGMGNAGEALRTSPSTLWLNPATMWNDALESSHATLSIDRKLDIISITKNFERGHRIGLGYASFLVDGLERRDAVGNLLGAFDDREEHGTVAYSITRGKLSLGAGLRAMRERLAEYRASASMVDLGLLYSVRGIDLGMGARGLGGSKKWKDTLTSPRDEADPFYYGAVAYRLSSLLFSGTLGRENAQGYVAKAGVEYSFTEDFKLRAGSDNGAETLGLGLRAKKFDFDVSYKMGELADETRFGITFTDPLFRRKGSRQFDRSNPRPLPKIAASNLVCAPETPKAPRP